jgi:retinol dehydrogenase-12
MTGKVCLVTGTTSGIGKATAEALARRGATVVGVGRNPEKCEATTRWIRQRTGRDDVDFLHADLSSQAEIRALVRRFHDRYGRLDVLVNNAGAGFMRRQQSVDGIEMTFALNYLGYFLLTNLMLATLRHSAPARIINVSSDSHRYVTLDFNDLQERNRYYGIRAYPRSKLAILLFTHELARRLEGTGVTANALHPGFVATGAFAFRGPVGWTLRQLSRRLAVSPEQGARTSIYLATAPEVEGITGGYFEKERLSWPSRASLDEAAARRLWGVSEEMTGLGSMTEPDAVDPMASAPRWTT